jgi:hypothetical protein
LHERYGVAPQEHAAAAYAAANPQLHSRADYAKIFTGKPMAYVKELVQMMQPPAMEEQMKRGLYQGTVQDAEKGAAVKGTPDEQVDQRTQAGHDAGMDIIRKLLWGPYGVPPQQK